MPCDSARSRASSATRDSSIRFASSSATSTFRASATRFDLRAFFPPKSPGSISWRRSSMSSMPGGATIPIGNREASGTSTSIVRSSRVPTRSIAASRSFSASPAPGGASASTSRSSAARSASARTDACISARTSDIAASTRSRTIDSTSRPT